MIDHAQVNVHRGLDPDQTLHHGSGLPSLPNCVSRFSRLPLSVFLLSVCSSHCLSLSPTGFAKQPSLLHRELPRTAGSGRKIERQTRRVKDKGRGNVAHLCRSPRRSAHAAWPLTAGAIFRPGSCYQWRAATKNTLGVCFSGSQCRRPSLDVGDMRGSGFTERAVFVEDTVL